MTNQAVDRRPIPAHIGAVVHAQVIESTEVTLLTTTPIVVNFAAPIHKQAPPCHDALDWPCSLSRLTASIASRAGAFDVARQLVEGLITEFDRGEPYPRIALRLRRMQLPQCD